MAGDRKDQVLAGHATTIVTDPDQALAAAGGEHIDAAGAGVYGVLDQFLDDAGWMLDHLAGGDAVDQVLGEDTDGHLCVATRAPMMTYRLACQPLNMRAKNPFFFFGGTTAAVPVAVVPPGARYSSGGSVR